MQEKNIDKYKGQISTWINSVYSQLDCLEEATKSLEEKMLPCLRRPTLPEKGELLSEEKEQDNRDIVPIALKLKEASLRLQNICSSIKNMRNRCEL